MTASTARIVIRHLSGSKANQIEQFDLDGLEEITLGRDSSSRIAYDLQRDDAVSRKHAVIRIKNDRELYFRIADLNSSNGTLLNGERISGEVELLPDDVVELGNGPKFTFDVQPRPANLPARATRQMGAIDAAATRIVADAPDLAATTELAVSDTAHRTAATDLSTQTKPPVGRTTIMRILTEERGKTRQIGIAALAAVVLLAVVGGGALYWHGQKVATGLAQELDQQKDIAAANKREAEANLSKQMGIAPAEIKRLGDATVYVRDQWQLYDRPTNRPIYQKMTNIEGEWLPCYVKMDDGKIVRWLTLDNNRDSNYQQVGGAQDGSGFVIGEQGFILTSRLIAAGWTSRYEDFSSKNDQRGAVFNLENRNGRSPIRQRIDNVDSLDGWVPDSGGYLFEATRPFRISSEEHDFYGRNELLTVQFPGTRIGINAALLRNSIEADVAEIKIDVGQPLSKLELADDYPVQVGEKIILLGYSGVSNKTRAVQETNVGGQVRFQDVYIPEPTVTEGVVALLPAKKRKDESGVHTYDTVGDNYQLDIYAGPGSGGGPVLNSAGKVIALDSLRSRSAQHVAFAVPVSYVRELLQPQRNSSQ